MEKKTPKKRLASQDLSWNTHIIFFKTAIHFLSYIWISVTVHWNYSGAVSRCFIHGFPSLRLFAPIKAIEPCLSDYWPIVGIRDRWLMPFVSKHKTRRFYFPRRWSVSHPHIHLVCWKYIISRHPYLSRKVQFINWLANSRKFNNENVPSGKIGAYYYIYIYEEI